MWLSGILVLYLSHQEPILEWILTSGVFIQKNLQIRYTKPESEEKQDTLQIMNQDTVESVFKIRDGVNYLEAHNETQR